MNAADIIQAKTAMNRVVLEKVGPENLPACGLGCLTNPKNPGYQRKREWLEQRFAEGLRLLLFRDGEGKPLAFLEGDRAPDGA